MDREAKNLSDINNLIKKLGELDRKNAEARKKLDSVKNLGVPDVEQNEIAKDVEEEKIVALEKKMTAFEADFKIKSEAIIAGTKRMNELLIGVIVVVVIALIGYFNEIFWHYRANEEKLWQAKHDYEQLIKKGEDVLKNLKK